MMDLMLSLMALLVGIVLIAAAIRILCAPQLTRRFIGPKARRISPRLQPQVLRAIAARPGSPLAQRAIDNWIQPGGASTK